MRSAEIADVRGRKLRKISLPGRTDPARGNYVSGDRLVGRRGFRVLGNGWPTTRNRTPIGFFGQKRINGRIGASRNSGRRQISEIAALLRGGRNPRLPNLATAFFVPLLRPEEKQLVLLDRPAYGVAVIVAPQKVLLPANRIADDAAGFLLPKEKVFGIKLVVAAEIVDVAVIFVSAGLGDEVDLGAAGAPILRTVAVAQNLKFLNRIHRGINENCPL